MKYTYEVSGTAAGGQSWKTTGEIETEPGDFVLALTQVMKLSFQQLTQGKAVFGNPGVGCRGPYSIKRYVLEAVPLS